MDQCPCDAAAPCVSATLSLGSEMYTVQGNNGILSEQLASMKEQSMIILKEFITKHNVPDYVPDETVEVSSEDDEEALDEKPSIRRRKRK
ncbi:hypothetical protein Syun_015823 [Stephania yunnanensis]|uniref:Uncharacterized protein n=1 Tax=Stephania yunnanensis TaxID=152371 RepID=A0AAP0P9P7_9MAGN